MPTRNINLTDELDHFIQAKIQTGQYGNISEVMREALRSMQREEEEYEAKLTALRAAIDEGDASGVAEGDPFAEAREMIKKLAKNKQH